MQRERLKAEHAAKVAKEKELQLREKMKKEVRRKDRGCMWIPSRVLIKPLGVGLDPMLWYMQKEKKRTMKREKQRGHG